MNDLERLFTAIPALRQLGPGKPYLRLHWSDDRCDTAVDADAEWREEDLDGDAPRLAVAVTELEGGQRRPVQAALFQIGTGSLIASGTTVSLAKSIPGPLQREAALRTLIDEMRGLKPLEPAV